MRLLYVTDMSMTGTNGEPIDIRRRGGNRSTGFSLHTFDVRSDIYSTDILCPEILQEWY